MKNIETKYDKIGTGEPANNEKVFASEINSIASELESAVVAGGQILDEANNYQLARSMTDHALGARHSVDTGTVNNYILSQTGSRYAPTTLVDGYVLEFFTGNANTTTTPTLNYATLGVKTIVAQNGTSPIAVGDIQVGVLNTVKYDGTNWRLISPVVNTASETVAGILKISTSAQALAGTDNETAMTPAKLFSLFSSALLSASSGYFKVPLMTSGARANAIIQFGADFTATTVQNITFPIVFPTACCAVVGTIIHNAGASVSFSAPTTTGFTAYKSSALGFRWVAVGYELI
jgi:hypothetical protein